MTSHPVRPSRRKRLLDAIALAEARLERLEDERARARNRLAALRSELASLGRASEVREASQLLATSGVPETSEEKVRLFRSLFRGRTDVFPTRFVSKRTGKAGYAPACRNKFVPGVCELPKIRCGECPNQAFLPFDDAAVLAHLTGRQVLGLYPLLEDETCWLLAVDFDKGTWTDDVIAFAETCRRVGLPAAVERSRSGRGAHVWFFFSAPVPASAARSMGCYLLTETLSRRQGSVIGLRHAEVDDTEPWTRRPSGRVRRARVTEPLPRQVRAVLAQRLFVEKAGLPSQMIDQIKRLAAFQNPEFYKRQRLRLSTATTPRVIACAEELPRHVALPRGCLGDLEALLRENSITLELRDERTSGREVRFEFRGALTTTQERAAKALVAHDTGVLVAPPGAGKTVIATWLVAARGCSTLVLVHRRPLLDQWLTQLSMFLGLKPREIGRIGGGKRAPNGRLDVAMIQSLVRKGRVDDAVASYGQVLVDECHHLPATSFERILGEAKARYVVGLTATPQRRDGHHPITEMQLGPVRFGIDPRSRTEARPFAQQLIVRETNFRMPSGDGVPTIQRLYAALAADEKRNALILDDVIRSLEEGRSPILLTERKDHLETLASHLEGFARHLIVLQGGMKASERKRVKGRLASIPESEERLLLATGRYVGEGFDDARLDTLFLALPVSWKGTLIQYAGRLHRPGPAKREVRIFDYLDRGVPMLERMFEKRLRGYRAIGYARGQAPPGFGEPPPDLVLEYDEEAPGAVTALGDRRSGH